MKPKYEIGQYVFLASFCSHASEYVTCPDCGGTGRIRVTFHDETTVSIPCANCSKGYEEPTGRIHVYCRKGKAKKARISGVNISGGKVEYRAEYHSFDDDGRMYEGYDLIDEDKIFFTEVEAQSRADIMAAEYDAEERERIFKKEKDQRSWAWNASYHRKEIKEAERRLEYHKKKLAYATIKSKADPKTTGEA